MGLPRRWRRQHPSAALLKDITEVFSTHSAFAALKADGSAVSWGDPDNGGDSSTVQEKLINIQTIIPHDNGFTAITGDETEISW